MMFVTVWLCWKCPPEKARPVTRGMNPPRILRKGGQLELLSYKHNMFVGAVKKAKYENRPFRLSPRGSPVLAHPAYGSGSELIAAGQMDRRPARLIAFGLQGVEAFYSAFTPKLVNETLSFAENEKSLLLFQTGEGFFCAVPFTARSGWTAGWSGGPAGWCGHPWWRWWLPGPGFQRCPDRHTGR